MTEGCTPLEVIAVLELHDHELAVRCLEVVRSHLPSILPAGFRHRVEVIPLCHHHSANCYPAFGVYGPEQGAEVWDAETRINAWITERGLDWLVSQSVAVVAPSWVDLQARVADAAEGFGGRRD